MVPIKNRFPGYIASRNLGLIIILDGAHNPSAVRSLAHSICNDFHFEKLILVLGVMKDKDIKNILKKILPLANRVIYTRPTYYRAANPQYLMDMAKQFGKAGEVHLHLSAAIDRARDLADKRDLILITGSLFTVGEAKSYLDPIRCPIEDI